MKKASKTMYLIGRIFNVIEIVLCVIFIIVGALLAAKVFPTESEEEAVALMASGITLIVFFAIILILSVVVLIMLNKAYKGLDTVEKKPHIVMIVLGAISTNAFLILGGIFALVASSQANNQAPQE